MKQLSIILALAALLSGLWAVGGVEGALLGTSELHETTLADAEGFPRRMIDPAGREILIARPPRRIVSLILDADEILTEIVAPERIAALTRFAANPSLSSCADKVPPGARLIAGETEEVLSLEPDLVIISPYTNTVATRFLIEAGVPVIRLRDVTSSADLRRNIEVIAAATGTEKEAARLLSEFDAQLADLQQRLAGLPRARVLYFSELGYTFGAGSSVDEILQWAGAQNVAASEGGVTQHARVGREFAASLRPDVLLVPAYGTGNLEEQIAWIYDDPIWQDSPAVRAGRVYPVGSASITSHSHYILKAAEQIARALHPEAFGS
ncbi:MAG: ABC transporter substrate-binding protein [Chrysiogenetes bacterium]|nr:ABC transporter substrate-binding protein [Chrysiogenetes bacterium]